MPAPVHHLIVRSRSLLGPGMVRLHLTQAEGVPLAPSGKADEYLRIWLPGASGETLQGSAVVSLRSWDPLCVDVVLKPQGALSAWAKRAETDETLLAGPLTGHHQPHPGLRWQLLVADEAGLPALARILEETPPGIQTQVLAEIAAPERQLPLKGADVTWLIGGNGAGPSRLAEAALAHPLPEGPGFVWVAAEQKAVRAIRRHLRNTLGLPASAYACVAYWIDRAEAWKSAYANLDAGTQARMDAIWSSLRDAETIRDEIDALLEARGL